MSECCPSCGYCRHCGRGGMVVGPYPLYPYYGHGPNYWQGNWGNHPHVTYGMGNQTVTSDPTMQVINSQTII